MHEPARRAHDVPAEHLPDALMPHAHAEDSEFRSQLLHSLEGDAAVLWSPRAGRDHDALGVHGRDLIHGLLVVLEHHVVLTEVAEVLYTSRKGMGRSGGQEVDRAR